MRNIKARVVPIAIGSLGATSNNLEKHIEEIPGNKIPRWQRQQYLAVHISYQRCSISKRLGKTPRSEKTPTSTQELNEEQETNSTCLMIIIT